MNNMHFQECLTAYLEEQEEQAWRHRIVQKRLRLHRDHRSRFVPLLKKHFPELHIPFFYWGRETRRMVVITTAKKWENFLQEADHAGFCFNAF